MLFEIENCELDKNTNDYTINFKLSLNHFKDILFMTNDKQFKLIGEMWLKEFEDYIKNGKQTQHIVKNIPIECQKCQTVFMSFKIDDEIYTECPKCNFINEFKDIK
jgi:phage FluMu protein Com